MTAKPTATPATFKIADDLEAVSVSSAISVSSASRNSSVSEPVDELERRARLERDLEVDRVLAVGDLQDEIMTSRMVPVWQVFDRFPRLVRDASRALGKQIDHTVDGLIRQSRVEPLATENGVASIAHLVARPDFDAYRAAIEQIRAAEPRYRFLLSGPWPP